MRTLCAAAVALALIAAAGAAQDAGVLLSPGAGAGEWRPLIDALKAKGSLSAPFTEHRFFPFRHDALVLAGVLRISPERGLSLQYTRPEESVVVADSSGMITRDAKGRSREVPAGARGSGAVAALLPIMRFDLDALYPRFDIRARREGAAWSFVFTPRDPEVARSLGEITVGGEGTDVRHLEFKRSQAQRIEIDVGETSSGVTFTDAETRQYFR